MLGVRRDQIVSLYHTHKSSYGSPNMCNRKGYKTPFRRPGYILLEHSVAWYAILYSSLIKIPVPEGCYTMYIRSNYKVKKASQINV